MPPKIMVAPVDNGPAAVQQRAHTTSMADFELPKTTLTKLAKGSVSWVSPEWICADSIDTRQH
jgi:hypothetical protein